MRTVKIAAAIVACAIQAYGAATVTASRDYVDRKTTLHPSSNGVEQVGYFLGTQTNKVLASKEYVDDSISASSPGDYLNVSNKAYMASSDTLKRLFSAAAYPAWEKSRQSSGNYTAGDIVSYSGMVYRCISTPSGTDAPDEYSSKWEVKTIGDLIAENTPGDYSNVSNNAYRAYAEIENRMSSVAAYPKWESGKQSAGGYVVGEIVSYSGLLYRCTAGASGTSTPDVYTNAWTGTTIGNLIDGNIPGDYSNVSNNAYGALQKIDTTNVVNSIVTNSSSGVLSMAFAYPLARFDYFNLQYPPNGSIVEKDGRLYRAKNDGYGDGSPWFPVDDTYYFEDVTEEMGTNALVRLSTLNMKKNDRITDEVNTIFADRKVYFQPMATNYYNRLTGPLGLTAITETNGVVTAADWGDGVQDGVGIFWMDGTWFLRQGGNTTSMTNGTPDDETVYIGNYRFVRQIVPSGSPVYVGELAMTNDFIVVPPSTNAAHGTVADAKATGDALYSGFTPWVCDNPEYEIKWYEWEGIAGWAPFSKIYPDDAPQGNTIGNRESLRLEWFDGAAVVDMTATRHAFPPTKTSQILNDGDGTNKFATVEMVSGVLVTNQYGVVKIGGNGLRIDSDTYDSVILEVGPGFAADITNTIRVLGGYNGGRIEVAGVYGAGDAVVISGGRATVGGPPYYEPEILINGTNIFDIARVIVTNIVTNIVSDVRIVGTFSQGHDSVIATNKFSFGSGTNVVSSGIASHAEGDRTMATAKAAHAEGIMTRATGEASHSSGVNTYASQRGTFSAGVNVTGSNSVSFVWSGSETSPWYGTHGKGTFNVNPIGGASGFFIGNENLIQVINASLMSDEPHAVTIEYDEGQPVTTNYPALRAAVEQIVLDTIRENSLSGIYDPQLQTWWTPAMVNGSYKFMATTNVDMNVESGN